MERFAEIFGACVMHAGVAALVAFAAAWIVHRIAKLAEADIPHRGIFAALAVVFAIYAGAKHGNVSFPFTDPEVRYLTDNGSYVTNDYVHIAFTTLLVPSSASLLIDRRELSSTNDADWVNHVTTTIGAFENPSDIAFPNATNYNWMVYTTWTPGPSVVTNGVLHANWANALSGGYKLPIRTLVIRDGDLLAPPSTNATRILTVTTPNGNLELEEP